MLILLTPVNNVCDMTRQLGCAVATSRHTEILALWTPVSAYKILPSIKISDTLCICMARCFLFIHTLYKILIPIDKRNFA